MSIERCVFRREIHFDQKNHYDAIRQCVQFDYSIRILLDLETENIYNCIGATNYRNQFER